MLIKCRLFLGASVGARLPRVHFDNVNSMSSFFGANVGAAGCLPKHFSPLTNCEDVDRMSSLLRCEFGAASSEGRLPWHTVGSSLGSASLMHPEDVNIKSSLFRRECWVSCPVFLRCEDVNIMSSLLRRECWRCRPFFRTYQPRRRLPLAWAGRTSHT